MPRQTSFLLSLIVILSIAGCGGGGGGSGSGTFNIGGTVTGLNGQVVLQDGSQTLTVSSDGTFTLPAAVADGSGYSVTVATQPAAQTCTVSGGGNGNGGGTVSGGNVTSLTVTCVNNTVAVGGTVRFLAPNENVVLQDNGADNLAITADGTFTFPTRVTNGGGYSVKVASQPSGQNCRVTGGDNGTGGGTAANGMDVTNIVVNCSYPRYAYVVNSGETTVSTYVVDPSSGHLIWIDKANTQTRPLAVTVGPSSKYAYVVNNGSNSVSEYGIGTDGSLSPIVGNASVGTGSLPVSFTIHPSGQYAYVANNGDKSVSQYTVGNDGSLSVMSSTTTTPTVAAGNLPTSVAIDPSGKYAYVTNSGDSTVSQYTVGTDGGLTPFAANPTVAAGVGPYGITIAASGKYAYVVNHNNGGTGSVTEYALGTDGNLTLLSKLGVPTGNSPVSMTLDPSGQHAYVANSGDNTISQYSVGSNGLLSPLSTAAVAAGTNPAAVSIDPSGKYAYATDAGGNTVSQYSIGSDGSLTPISPATVPGAASPGAIAFSQGPAAVQQTYATISATVTGQTPSGLVLVNNGIDNLTINAGGTFTFPIYVANGDTYSVSVATQPSQQTCDVSAGSGTVSGGNVGITVNCFQNNVTIGGTVRFLSSGQSMVLQNNGGDDVTVSGDGTFTFPTKLGNGSTYAVTVATPPTGQICRITGGGNGTGGGTATDGVNVTTIVVDCGSPRYAYVVNHDDRTISSYVMDATMGRLKWINKADTQVNPQAVTIDPSGQYVYVVNNGSNSVSEYSIGSDGSLTPIQGNVSIGTGGTYPVSVAVHPSGNYAYVASQTGTVSQYTIGSDGSLSSISAAPTIAAGNLPTSITVDPSGQYAYVANSGDNTVSQYTVGSDGSLTPITGKPTVATGPEPYEITVTSSGKYAYVVNHNTAGTGSISEYSIGSDGSLTALSGSPVAAGTQPVSITVDASSHFAYVPNASDGTVSQYGVGSDGSLTPLSPAISAGADPTNVAIDPTGKFAYVTNATDNTVSQFSVASDGSLTPIAPSVIAGYAKPQAIAVAEGVAAAQPVAQYVFVANINDSSISQFTIDSSGGLTPNGTISTNGASPVAVTVSPSGRYAYVVDSGGSLLEYTVNSSGVLAPNTSQASAGTGHNPACVAVDPLERYVYVTNGGDNNVSQYTIATDGSLTPVSSSATVGTGSSPVCLTVDPTGRYAYVTNGGSGGTGSVSQYVIGSDGGLIALSPAAVTTSGAPYGIAVDPSGQYLYTPAANGTVNVVNQFQINNGGTLSQLSPATTVAGSTPVAIAVDPSGRYAYVTNIGSNDISPYTLSTGGTLAAITGQTTVALPTGSTLPVSLAIDPSGNYVYVIANNNSSTAGQVVQYSIGTGGALATPPPTPVNAGTGAWYIATSGTWK